MLEKTSYPFNHLTLPWRAYQWTGFCMVGTAVINVISAWMSLPKGVFGRLLHICDRNFCENSSRLFNYFHKEAPSLMSERVLDTPWLLMLIDTNLWRVFFKSGTVLITEPAPIGVLKRRYFENMQQIYRRTPMLKCDFNTVAVRTEVFLIKAVLKTCSKFTGKHLWESAISVKLLCNKGQLVL